MPKDPGGASQQHLHMSLLANKPCKGGDQSSDMRASTLHKAALWLHRCRVQSDRC